MTISWHKSALLIIKVSLAILASIHDAINGENCGKDAMHHSIPLHSVVMKIALIHTLVLRIANANNHM